MASRICVALILSSIYLAQAPARPGTVRGHIVDPVGAVIPRANIFVHASYGADKVEYMAASDQQGNFVLTLQPGGYDILVTSPGFEASVQTIGVRAGHTEETRWKLKPHSCEFPGVNCDTFQ